MKSIESFTVSRFPAADRFMEGLLSIKLSVEKTPFSTLKSAVILSKGIPFDRGSGISI